MSPVAYGSSTAHLSGGFCQGCQILALNLHFLTGLMLRSNHPKHLHMEQNASLLHFFSPYICYEAKPRQSVTAPSKLLNCSGKIGARWPQLSRLTSWQVLKWLLSGFDHHFRTHTSVCLTVGKDRDVSRADRCVYHMYLLGTRCLDTPNEKTDAQFFLNFWI